MPISSDVVRKSGPSKLARGEEEKQEVMEEKVEEEEEEEEEEEDDDEDEEEEQEDCIFPRTVSWPILEVAKFELLEKFSIGPRGYFVKPHTWISWYEIKNEKNAANSEKQK